MPGRTARRGLRVPLRPRPPGRIGPMNGRLPGKGRPGSSAAAGRRPPSWLGRATRPPWSSGGGLRAVLVRGAGGTFALKVTAAGLGFVASLLLARLLGAAGYGAYAYAQSWLTLLAVPATLGMDTLLVRNVAAYRARSEWGPMRGILRHANRTVLATSAGLAVSAAAAAAFFRGSLEPQMLPALLVAMCSLPLVALIYVRQGAMRGLQRVVVGQLPETLIR